MTLTREEKIYRAEIEERVDRMESVLQIHRPSGEEKEVTEVSGWRGWVEEKLKGLERSETLEEITGSDEEIDLIPPMELIDAHAKRLDELEAKWEPLFNVGSWIDETRVRLKEIEARIAEVVEIDKRYELKDGEVRDQAKWIKEHMLQSKSIDTMQSNWNKFLKDVKRLKDDYRVVEERVKSLETVIDPRSTQDPKGIRERIKDAEELGREHELELYGKGNGNGLTRRVERVEETKQILMDQIWWIRKGVLIVLILSLWSLIQMWWRFGW